MGTCIVGSVIAIYSFLRRSSELSCERLSVEPILLALAPVPIRSSVSLEFCTNVIWKFLRWAADGDESLLLEQWPVSRLLVIIGRFKV